MLPNLPLLSVAYNNNKNERHNPGGSRDTLKAKCSFHGPPNCYMYTPTYTLQKYAALLHQTDVPYHISVVVIELVLNVIVDILWRWCCLEEAREEKSVATPDDPNSRELIQRRGERKREM